MVVTVTWFSFTMCDLHDYVCFRSVSMDGCIDLTLNSDTESVTGKRAFNCVNIVKTGNDKVGKHANTVYEGAM